MIGNKNKNGVIISTKGDLNYYSGTGDNSLKILMKANQPTKRVQTIKSFDTVTIANNKVTVTVSPDGEVKVTPSE